MHVHVRIVVPDKLLYQVGAPTRTEVLVLRLVKAGQQRRRQARRGAKHRELGRERVPAHADAAAAVKETRRLLFRAAASLGKGNAAISKVVCAKAAAARHRFKVVLKSCPVPAPVDTALAMGSFKIALPGGRRAAKPEDDDEYGTSLDADFGI